MRKRSLPVVALGWLFIAAGLVGIVYHAPEWRTGDRLEAVLELGVRLLAIIGGAFALRGANWSRWLLVAWLVFHVILSVVDPFALVAHAVLLIVVTYLFFFHKPTSVHFQSVRCA